MTAEPSIIVRKLKPQDLFLIFASDGLWEHLSDERAVEIVLNHPRTVSLHQTQSLCRLFSFCLATLISNSLGFYRGLHVDL